MLEQFLHEQLEIAFEWGVPKPEIPGSITQNLNPAFELRPYQEDAYASFIHYFNTDLPGKEKPVHLLFNMATGSGKTLIMAGLILYLYEKGSRNFFFLSIQPISSKKRKTTSLLGYDFKTLSTKKETYNARCYAYLTANSVCIIGLQSRQREKVGHGKN